MRSWLDTRRSYKHAPATVSGEHDNQSSVLAEGSAIEGVFAKCEGCGDLVYAKHLADRYGVCPNCEFHHPLPARQRIRLLTDPESFIERDADLLTGDPLSFDGYRQKLAKVSKKTGQGSAVISGSGTIGGHPVMLAAMDFRFIGGSMGSVVGEKVTSVVEAAGERRLPLVIVSASGGARMFEGVYSLMQMAKTSVALSRFAERSLPYVSVLTDPTFGGVTASFATVADVIIAEPGARIGFAGARVIEDTTKEKLPQGFQTAEFQREHGMVDRIVHRLSLKNDIERLLRLVT